MTASERRDLRDDMKTEIEEIDADLVGLLYDLEELKKTILIAKVRRITLVRERNALKTAKA